jgi:hypothetical protein
MILHLLQFLYRCKNLQNYSRLISLDEDYLKKQKNLKENNSTLKGRNYKDVVFSKAYFLDQF